MRKIYEPIKGEHQVLRIKNMQVKLKAGENAEELVDKIEALIKRFSEDGEWTFRWDVEG